MKVVILAVAVIVGILLVGGLMWWVARYSRKLRENLEAALRKWGGRLEKSFWRGTSLHYEVDGCEATLQYFTGTDKAPPWTKIQFDWTPPGRLRVAPEGFFAKFKKFFGAEDIQIGDASFDEQYLIQGSPREWVHDVLDRETRGELVELANLGTSFWRGKGIRLDVAPAGVTFFCYRNLVEERENLFSYLQGTERIFRRLKAAVSAGMKILSVEEVIRQGNCPICGDGLEGKVRRCRSCRTPHHRDCWSYFGGCAIYACGTGRALPEPDPMKGK